MQFRFNWCKNKKFVNFPLLTNQQKLEWTKQSRIMKLKYPYCLLVRLVSWEAWVSNGKALWWGQRSKRDVMSCFRMWGYKKASNNNNSGVFLLMDFGMWLAPFQLTEKGFSWQMVVVKFLDSYCYQSIIYYSTTTAYCAYSA